MFSKIIKVVLGGVVIAGAILFSSGAAMAIEAGDILVRLRGIALVPTDESNGISPDLTSSGLEPQPMGVPELDFTYMVTKNIGVELILATSPHDLDVTGALSSLNKGAEVWLLPPTLLLQYHFLPDEKIRPYIGAGINYTVSYGENASNSLETALGGPTSVKASDSLGWAVQIGVDYDIDDRWFLNLDVKYVAISLDTVITTGGTRRTTEIDINPIIVGVGFGYRF